MADCNATIIAAAFLKQSDAFLKQSDAYHAVLGQCFKLISGAVALSMSHHSRRTMLSAATNRVALRFQFTSRSFHQQVDNARVDDPFHVLGSQFVSQ